MTIDYDDLKKKRAAVRREIKERMQRELEDRKRRIKERVAQENISVDAKREKYRREVHQEKLLLMERAKEEFRARKRMLGLTPEQERELRRLDEPPPLPPEYDDEFVLQDESETPSFHHMIKPEEAFDYSDESQSALREYQAPIGAGDALPLDMAPLPSGPSAMPQVRFEEEPERKSLFYYMVNLVFHPVQTLDEFDDYLNAPHGIVKVILFYFVSLLPIVVFIIIGEKVTGRIPGGLVWALIGIDKYAQAGAGSTVLFTVLDLLLYSFSIAIVNYFATNEANFVTLTVYFAFVQSVVRIVTYSLIIFVVLAALFATSAPSIVGIVILLLLAYFIWGIALNIIVLMSAYGYDLFFAFMLAFFASYVGRVLRLVVFGHLLGMEDM
ncbi:MAG: hypothetical protein Kow0099_36890 [Candidatus Abyssubacteria bacterium]